MDILLQQLAVVVDKSCNGIFSKDAVANLTLHRTQEVVGYFFLLGRRRKRGKRQEGERTVRRERGQSGGREDSQEGERTVRRERGQSGGREESQEGERTVRRERGQSGGREDSQEGERRVRRERGGIGSKRRDKEQD